MKHWHPVLDPSIGPLIVQHLWALLLGWPMELWNVRLPEAFGNQLGKLVLVDEKSLLFVDKKVERVLVEVYISKGLIPDIEIEWRKYF